jgi:hypothetical protein
VGIKQADLDIILADLEREGRIKRAIGKHRRASKAEDNEMSD